MAEVVIESKTYDVYADLVEADTYLEAALHADGWRSATEETKQRALVTATRTLDRQNWVGEKVDDDQALDWPRTNTGLDDVTDSEIPEDIISASIELALALVDGSDTQNQQNGAQKIQSLKAGSVSITYFRGAEGKAVRFPQIIWELVSRYITGTSRVLVPSSHGTGKESTTEDDFGFTEGI